jgi:hypothetical protein
MPKSAAPSDPLDEVESSAIDDLLAAIDEGDKAAAKAALRDFVTACLKRNEVDEYEGTEDDEEDE